MKTILHFLAALFLISNQCIAAPHHLPVPGLEDLAELQHRHSMPAVKVVKLEDSPDESIVFFARKGLPGQAVLESFNLEWQIGQNWESIAEVDEATFETISECIAEVEEEQNHQREEWAKGEDGRKYIEKLINKEIRKFSGDEGGLAFLEELLAKHQGSAEYFLTEEFSQNEQVMEYHFLSKLENASFNKVAKIRSGQLKDDGTIPETLLPVYSDRETAINSDVLRAKRSLIFFVNNANQILFLHKRSGNGGEVNDGRPIVSGFTLVHGDHSDKFSANSTVIDAVRLSLQVKGPINLDLDEAQLLETFYNWKHELAILFYRYDFDLDDITRHVREEGNTTEAAWGAMSVDANPFFTKMLGATLNEKSATDKERTLFPLAEGETVDVEGWSDFVQMNYVTADSDFTLPIADMGKVAEEDLDYAEMSFKPYYAQGIPTAFSDPAQRERVNSLFGNLGLDISPFAIESPRYETRGTH